jgi:hypothetical protein
MPAEPVQVTLLVIEALEDLGIPYLIGGSLASAVHGVIRTTMDADIIADMHPGHAQALATRLGDAFYADVDSINNAIENKISFNLIYLETMFKVDIFPLKERAFERSEMQRRTLHIIATDPERTVFVASAEDIILAKLEWFRMGGELSERQWRDVQGILKVQAGTLDMVYLKKWAGSIGVIDLLDKAISELED